MKWSDEQDPECFLCPSEGRPDPVEVPWDWSMPRALCVSHKTGLTVEDGETLGSLMDRVAPPDGYLEGSGLAFIYNPVFVRAEDGRVVKGWTDFAAGGMAVFEDRFAAANYFEHRALETPRGVDLLHALRSQRAPATWDDLYDRLASESCDSEAGLPARPIEGYRDLVHYWNLGRHIARRRAATGRQWPESWDELCDWLVAPLDRWTPELGTEEAFHAALESLCARRFPPP